MLSHPSDFRVQWAAPSSARCRPLNLGAGHRSYLEARAATGAWAASRCSFPAPTVGVRPWSDGERLPGQNRLQGGQQPLVDLSGPDGDPEMLRIADGLPITHEKAGR